MGYLLGDGAALVLKWIEGGEALNATQIIARLQTEAVARRDLLSEQILEFLGDTLVREKRTCDNAILFLGCGNSKVAISSCNKTFVLRKPCVKEGNSEKTPLIEAEENSADDDSNDDKLVEVGGGVKRRLVYLTRKECKSSNVDIGDAIKFLQKNKKRKTEKKGSSSSVII